MTQPRLLRLALLVTFYALLPHPAPAVEALRGDLRRVLADPSPSVRITAAWALGQYGNAADLALALPVLKTLAPPATSGAYAPMLAVNSIDALGPRAASLHEMLRSMDLKDPQAPGRANGYVGRLVTRILSTSQPEAKR